VILYADTVACVRDCPSTTRPVDNGRTDRNPSGRARGDELLLG
jgi:hypothetical protein